MRINTNLTAMNTYTQYTQNNSKIASSVAKLSSGSAINSAADNATGLAISEKMRAHIRGLNKAQTNAQDAISLVQTAEGALSSSTEILQRMRELAVQSSSDTNENEIDRQALQDEFSQLQSELNDIAKNTTFNKKTLLDGSLATETKNLGAATLANSGMTVELGNAATGSYNFSVSTKLESAAVSAKKPATPELVMDGADGYFARTGNSAALGGSVKASDLLNGNYTLKATYADPTSDNGDGSITVTASGDNGQTFTAKISSNDLAKLKDDATLSVSFNASADDAFNLTLELGDTITASESNYDTLASNISKLSVSVTGGVTARDAEYGVYANLTGANSVKLSAGMNSVTFDNGVKINFDTLTASSVDTANRANITDATTVVGPSAANLAAGLGTINGQAITAAGTSMTFTDASGKIAQGDYTITSDATGILTLTDSTGTKYTAAAQSTTAAAAPQTLSYQFKDSAGTNAFTGSLTLAAGGSFTAGAVSFTGTLSGTRGYALSNASANSTATLSGFTFSDDSNISNGDITVTAADDGTTTTFTATDAAGTKYEASILNSAMDAATSSGSVTNKLNFISKSTDKAPGFTVDLTTTNDGATGTTFTNNATISTGLTVASAGHNYTKIFGAGTDSNLAVSTASNFTVDAAANSGLTFQVGANEGDAMVINIHKMDASDLGVASSLVGTPARAQAALTAADSAINQVSAQRAYLGAVQNRLDYKISNLNTSTENLTSAESQIRDVDMAKEMTKFTNANILNQAATAMLAQANSLPQGVLSLIGG